MDDNSYFSKKFMRALLVSATIIFSTLLLASFQGFDAPPDVANQIATDIQHEAATTTWLNIFLNNLLLTLVVFVPFFGIVFSLFVQFNTGYAIGAIAQTEGVSNVLITLLLLTTPVGVLEYVSYIFALAESIILAYSAYKRQLKHRLVNSTWKTILLVAVLLLIGAVVEAALLGRL